MEQFNYAREHWQDHLVDPTDGAIVQQGTRFTADRMNNIESALDFLCNVNVPQTEAEFLRMQLELEMLGRSPVNNGTFFDGLDGETPKLMVRDTAKATLQNAVTVGATTLQINKPNQFAVGEMVTLVDEEKTENVTVTAVNADSITVTKTVNTYKKGAYVTRCNNVLDTQNKALKFSSWATYNVEVL